MGAANSSSGSVAGGGRADGRPAVCARCKTPVVQDERETKWNACVCVGRGEGKGARGWGGSRAR